MQVTEGGTTTDLEGAQVTCWGKNRNREHTLLTGVATADASGVATLSYSNLRSDAPKPNIFCEIKGENIVTFYTPTKRRVYPLTTLDLETITVYPDRFGRGDPGFYNGCGSEDRFQFVIDFMNAFTGLEEVCTSIDLCYQSCIET